MENTVVTIKSKEELVVSKLHSSHVREVHDLDEICMGYQKGWSEKTWTTCFGFVAMQRDVLAGAIQYVMVPMGKKKGLILIGKIIVLPDCRRQGVGSELVEAVKKKSLIGRIRYVTANVYEDDLDICCFFRANGFEVVMPPKELLEKKYYLMRWRVATDGSSES